MSSRLGGDNPNNPPGPDPNPDTTLTGIANIKAPANFNYNTVNTKQIIITVLGNDNNPIPYTPVLLMDNSIEAGGNIIFKGATNLNGVFATSIDLPAYYKKIVCNTGYLGVPRNIILDINNSTLQSFTIGGTGLNQFETAAQDGSFNPGSGKKFVNKFSKELGGWNSNGRPFALMTPNTTIGSDMILNTSALLPERFPLTLRRPDLLDDAITTRTIQINGVCEVFVSFVHESSPKKNVLFYYSYPTGAEPSSINDIDSFFVVLPNASFNKSGGELGIGNKISLGFFNAGTTIAFGIAANGWQGGNNGLNGVTTGTHLFFCNQNLNPEANPFNKQHAIMINDPANSRLITAFEDGFRDDLTTDNDFNDLIFVTETAPLNAYDFTSVAALPVANDADGDNIPDIFDEKPNDVSRAFTNVFPAFGSATVAFEDTWPKKGDFDMNDIVVDFKHTIVTDGENRVKDIEGFYTLRARGSSNENSFAVEYPVLRSNVTAFSGGVLEGMPANATVRIFSNSSLEMSEWNTKPTLPASDSINYNVKFSLITPIAASVLNLGIYNPFIWGNNNGKDRTFEIHLPGKNFTNIADVSIFKTEDDNTDLSGTNTYKSKDNLFWAICTPFRFEYPKEGEDITKAYLRFVNWANTGGNANGNWFKNEPGYRNEAFIYKKP
ncbi:MAG: LruC domain-containing protein [Bacteroidia bacterium]